MNPEPPADGSGPMLVPGAGSSTPANANAFAGDTGSSTPANANAFAGDPGSGGEAAPPRVSPWGARIALVIEVMIWLELGMILIFVPWKRAWTDNSLILNYPQLREFLGMNFVRGAVTGIGLLDLWIGISRAVYYKDPGKT